MEQDLERRQVMYCCGGMRIVDVEEVREESKGEERVVMNSLVFWGEVEITFGCDGGRNARGQEGAFDGGYGGAVTGAKPPFFAPSSRWCRKRKGLEGQRGAPTS